MLYLDTGWVDYETDNEIINLYLNLRNVYRYIKENKNNLKYVADTVPFSFFHKKKPTGGYIDLSDIFEMDKFSYNYRKVLDRFKSSNINDITTFFELIDDLTDFFLFLKDVDTLSRYDIKDIKIFAPKDEKKWMDTTVNGKSVCIAIEETAIENIRRSGSILLDLLDTKDKNLTFYTLNINNTPNPYKFITGEDPKLTLEEKIVISDIVDNLLVRMLNETKHCLLYDITNIWYMNDIHITIDDLDNSLVNGKISYKYWFT